VRARAAAIERLDCVDKGKKGAPLTISVTFVLHFSPASSFLISVSPFTPSSPSLSFSSASAPSSPSPLLERGWQQADQLQHLAPPHESSTISGDSDSTSRDTG